MFRSRFVVAVCAALYFATMASLAFVITPGSDGRFWLGTAVAFIPVGIFLVCMFGRRRWWAALAFSVVAAAWLEAAQTVWMPAGYAGVVDILIASIGAGVGVSIAFGIAIWWERAQHVHSSPQSPSRSEAHALEPAQSVGNLASRRRASASNSVAQLNLDR